MGSPPPHRYHAGLPAPAPVWFRGGVLGHHRIAGLLGRPLVVAVTGAVGMVLVVWGTAAPAVEGRSRWGGDVVDRTDAGWSTLVLQFACAGDCVPGDLGSDARGSDRLGAVLGSTSVAVLGIVATLALALLVRALLGLAAEPRRSPARASGIAPAVGVGSDLLAAAVTDDSTGRLHALLTGTPTQGIVAAWTRLETTVQAAGIQLAPSRTSSEVCVEVLRRLDVERDTLGALAALYREARWSQHVLTETDRGRAVDAYRALDSDLHAAAARRPVHGGRR